MPKSSRRNTEVGVNSKVRGWSAQLPHAIHFTCSLHELRCFQHLNELRAACVAPPAPQYPAHTEHAESCNFPLWRTRAPIQQQQQKLQRYSEEHFPQFTSLLGKRFPKCFSSTERQFIYRLKITVMEKQPVRKALPPAVRQRRGSPAFLTRHPSQGLLRSPVPAVLSLKR